MILRSKRFSYAPTETESILTLSDGTAFATIEQPWVPNPNGAKGGKPFHSCVPDGMYQLLPWDSPSKGQVYIMFNPDLGVHKLPEHHEKDHERDLCLIHVANFAHEIQGCIGIGKERGLLDDQRGNRYRAVTSSRTSMKLLLEKLGRDGHHILSIESVMGATDQ